MRSRFMVTFHNICVSWRMKKMEEKEGILSHETLHNRIRYHTFWLTHSFLTDRVDTRRCVQTNRC